MDTPTKTMNRALDEEDSVHVYMLDVGLGANVPNISKVGTSGQVLHLSPSTGKINSIVTGQSLPDGIDVSKSTGRMFWTNMGKTTSSHDGSVHSAKLDGSDIKTIVASGTVHTPKQLIVDDEAQHVYFCDREGMSLHRVNFEGSDHKILVRTGFLDEPNQKKDMTRWCVGIALDRRRRYIYWTQKGPSKGGQGRIFRCGMDIPAGQDAESRQDVELVLKDLPEPIDLEFDEETDTIYWTDRSEHPTGCSLNRLAIGNGRLDAETLAGKKEIIARHFHEPIGLKLDVEKGVYVTDLGGSVYYIKRGKKTVVHNGSGCYTGITLVNSTRPWGKAAGPKA